MSWEGSQDLNHTNRAQSDSLLSPSPTSPRQAALMKQERSNRTGFRRAKRACFSCRNRRVRCDVTMRHPCANCRWGNKECVVAPRRARRVEGRLDERNIGEWFTARASPTNFLPFTSPLPADVWDPRQSDDGLDTWDDQRQLLSDYRCFMKPPPAHLSHDDMDYLRLKEATVLPPPKMQNALLRAYLEYVHPMLPIINLEDFLESISTVDDTTGRVSLAFFQAVMFAGSAFVDMSVLKNAGYPTRAEARNLLYRKVQLLYNFDYETDRLVLIQILLLMSLWHETLDRTRNAGHWIDIAVSHAYAIGLHADPLRSKPPMSISGQRLRRRIWWCCFIRDRYVCLGGERVPQIKDSDFNVRILELADFQSEHLKGKVPSASYAICPYISDANKRENLGNLCIDQIKLCKGSVFINECHYTISSEEPLLHEKPSKRFPIDAEAFANFYRRLLEWYDSSSQCNATQPYSLDPTSMNYDKHILVCRVMLLMVYHGQILQLHRLRLEDPQISLFERSLSRMLANHSSQRISRLAKATQDLGINEFLPGTTIGIIKLALAMGHSETKDDLQAVASEDNECLSQCTRTLEILQEIHVATDRNIGFTDDLSFDNTDPDLYKEIGLDLNTCVDDDAENEDPEQHMKPLGITSY